MTTTILAGSAYAAGVVVGRLLPVILVGAVILGIGLTRRTRARRAGAPLRGGVAVVVGSVLLGVALLGALVGVLGSTLA